MQERSWIQTAAGVAMPWIVYGTAWKQERTADLVTAAVSAGFRGIDTACQPKHYDEAGVGEALSRLQERGIARESLFLQTKFTPVGGQDPARIPYDPRAPLAEQVAQSFAVSQKNLRTEYVDSLVLHSPLARRSELMEVWRAMEAIHLGGGARQLGISNCYDREVLSRLHDDAEVKPAVVQNRFYQDTEYDSDLRRWCAERGLVYQSFWTLTANPHVLSSEAVRSVAAGYGKNEAPVFFRYLNQIGIVPLTGTCDERHMQEDLEVFDFELTAGEVAAVTAVLGRD